MSRALKLIAILLLSGLPQLAAAEPLTRPVERAPIGDLQPRMSDLPSDTAAIEGRVSPETKDLDKKLNICRGC